MGAQVMSDGRDALDFSLPDEHSKTVSLKELRGRWIVLYFYPRDNTPGCTREAIDFTARAREFKKLGALILGVSTDSAESHCKFISDHNLGITLLSDHGHKVMEAYGAWALKKNYGKEYWGVVRSTFIIDPEGRLAASWSNVKVDGHADAVKARLEQLQAGQ